MLACIACSKRLNDSIDDDGSATPRSPASREAIKNLTAQIKEMALKASGSYRYSKPSGLSREGQLRFMLESELEGSECGTPSRGVSTSARPSNVLFSASRPDLLRSSNSSSNGTPKFNNAAEPMEEEEQDEECKEWISHVEPGVIITLISLDGGENQLKRIRFSRELFNKRQAQLWWTENQEKVLELYNIVRPNTKGENGDDIPRSIGEEKDDNLLEANSGENILPIMTVSANSSRDADRSDDLQSCSDKYSMHSATNSSEQEQEQDQEQDEEEEHEQEQEEQEWVEEDEPGVYITIYSSPGGAREVKRVRFSREKFSEMQARLWWADNRQRIQEQYIYGHAL